MSVVVILKVIYADVISQSSSIFTELNRPVDILSGTGSWYMDKSYSIVSVTVLSTLCEWLSSSPEPVDLLIVCEFVDFLTKIIESSVINAQVILDRPLWFQSILSLAFRPEYVITDCSLINMGTIYDSVSKLVAVLLVYSVWTQANAGGLYADILVSMHRTCHQDAESAKRRPVIDLLIVSHCCKLMAPRLRRTINDIRYVLTWLTLLLH